MVKVKAKKTVKFKKPVIKEEAPEIETAEELDKEIQAVEEKMEVIGRVQTQVYQKSSFIKTKAYNSPVCLYELPEDIRTYLTNM
jgi:hypothetical protein